MANPRKFSEKIALHTQKQAEETAAFEAILQEVNSATRDPPRYQKQQHIAPNLGTYRGGSLPNVNQISANQGIDLQATLQHLDDMKQGRSTLVHGRQERQRQQIGPHRRNFPTDKRIDSSPYGSAYHLSPPPDTSWRRVHSDPSLHMNAMGNANNKNYTHPPVTPPSHRRIVEMVGENAGDGLQMNYWDSKKMGGPSRPKSCEVPNINIYPSQEHDGQNSSSVIPMTTSNTGSLPDLSVLQFPSPLSTPLDQEDPYNTGGTGNSPVSLSPTSPRHMPMSHQNPQSPNQRRRQTSGISLPSPLVLNQIGGQSTSMADMDPCMRQYLCLQQQQQQQLQQQQQQQLRHQGTQSPLNQPYPTPVSPLYSPTHQKSLNHRQATKPSLPCYQHNHVSSPAVLSTQTPHLPSQSQTHSSNFTQSLHQNNNHQHNHQQQQTPLVPQVHITNCDELGCQASMTQYRNTSVSDSNCQSPTSPHSAPSYSPAQSPGITPTSQSVNSTFSDAYYIQQQQQQTNALQHQFEQFNMHQLEQFNNMSPLQVTSTNMCSTVMTTNGLNLVSNSNSTCAANDLAFSQQLGLALQYTQAAMLAMSSNDDIFQPHFLGPIDVMASGQFNSQLTMSSQNNRQMNQQNSLSSPTSGSKIPDIILTGADDMCRLPLDFAKDLGNAITGMSDSFDADFLTNDEAFKAGLDPLDFDEIQMLTDASLVADPATEDSFKLDRL
ncbi:CREB-regulated transcription coactivator 1-like isoform X2 [Physella acuta]|uniref:CREB-regulated transcription coactivator 1-like isoform X2 n=1 Tax=Physella acuta TaxID=109671 RepID=UPI0027DBAA0C|nr:CREB-regulated transcription coactivator 1-like isoform X2 [Physella acuta]